MIFSGCATPRSWRMSALRMDQLPIVAWPPVSIIALPVTPPTYALTMSSPRGERITGIVKAEVAGGRMGDGRLAAGVDNRLDGNPADVRLDHEQSEVRGHHGKRQGVRRRCS